MAGDKPTAWQKEAEELAKDRTLAGACPEKDCLNLEAEPQDLFEADEQDEYQAALIALMHPSQRQQADIEAQIAALGWYQKRKAQQAGKAGKHGQPALQDASDAKMPAWLDDKKPKKKRVRALRADLAAKFRKRLETAGSAEQRLKELTPAVLSKKQQADRQKNNKQKKLSVARKVKKADKKKATRKFHKCWLAQEQEVREAALAAGCQC